MNEKWESKKKYLLITESAKHIYLSAYIIDGEMWSVLNLCHFTLPFFGSFKGDILLLWKKGFTYLGCGNAVDKADLLKAFLTQTDAHLPARIDLLMNEL